MFNFCTVVWRYSQSKDMFNFVSILLYIEVFYGNVSKKKIIFTIS